MAAAGGPLPIATNAPPPDQEPREQPPDEGGGRAAAGARSPLWSRLRRWLPVFIGAAAVRIAYWVLVTPTYVPIADGDQYRRLGRRLAAGKGFELVYPQLEMHPTAFRPPAYPALLAPGFRLFGSTSLWPARLLGVLLGALVVVLAGVLAARIGGRIAGYVAAFAAAVYPPLVGADTVVMSDTMALALLLGAILLVDDRRWVGAGVATGLLMLTRPNVYAVLLVLAVWLWRTIGWRRALGFVGCALLVVLPWSIRNKVQVDTWRLTTSDGLTLAGIYAPPAQRGQTFVDPVFAQDYSDLSHRLAQFDEAGWSERLTREAIDGIRHNPGYVWTVLERNTRGYFELDTSLNRFPEDSDGRDWRFRQTTLPAFFVVTTLGLVGTGLGLASRDRRLIVLGVITAQFVVISLLLVAPPRLRSPFDLAMCVGTGLLIGWVADLRARARSRVAAPVNG